MKPLKSLSAWAKKHVWAARFILLALHLLLVTIGIYWGMTLYVNHIIITSTWWYVGIGGFIAAALMYPIKGSSYKIWKHHFTKQKIIDLALGICSLFLITVLSNQCCVELARNPRTTTTTIVNASFSSSIDHQGIKELPLEKQAKKRRRKELKRELRSKLKQLRRRKVSVGDVLIVLMTLIVSIAILIGTTYLSCSLFCGGPVGLAILVLFSGVGLIMFLNVAVIRGLIRKNGGGTNKMLL